MKKIYKRKQTQLQQCPCIYQNEDSFSIHQNIFFFFILRFIYLQLAISVNMAASITHVILKISLVVIIKWKSHRIIDRCKLMRCQYLIMHMYQWLLNVRRPRMPPTKPNQSMMICSGTRTARHSGSLVCKTKLTFRNFNRMNILVSTTYWVRTVRGREYQSIEREIVVFCINIHENPLKSIEFFKMFISV